MEWSSVVWWDLRTTLSSGYWERTFTRVRKTPFFPPPLPLPSARRVSSFLLRELCTCWVKNASSLSFWTQRCSDELAVKVVLPLSDFAEGVEWMLVWFVPLVSSKVQILCLFSQDLSTVVKEKCRREISVTFEWYRVLWVFWQGACWDVIGILQSI